MSKQLTKSDKMLVDIALCYFFTNAKPKDIVLSYEGILRLAEIRTQIASESILKGLSNKDLNELSEHIANKFWYE